MQATLSLVNILLQPLGAPPYASSVIQNQVIDVLADQVRQKIIGNVQVAKWFSLIADDVTDVSNKEQLSLVLRYVEPDTLLVREDLVGFFECDTGISGRALADKITSCVRAYGLDLSNLQGQAYDGAGNMAGSVNGTAALIASDYPLVIYLHCTSHCLNLAVVKSLQITSVHNMMSVVERVFNFFAIHPKRQRALEQAILDTQPESTVHKLKDLCCTTECGGRAVNLRRARHRCRLSTPLDKILDMPLYGCGEQEVGVASGSG